MHLRGKHSLSINDNVILELRKINRVLTLSNAERIEEELSKIATTSERKKIWVMINGDRSQDDIANALGVARRTVNIFVGVLATADLVDAQRGKPPRRILNYVPPSWLDLVQVIETQAEAGPGSEAATSRTQTDGAEIAK
jgi:hypothetical protein